jgi:hypothetical protein
MFRQKFGYFQEKQYARIPTTHFWVGAGLLMGLFGEVVFVILHSWMDRYEIRPALVGMIVVLALAFHFLIFDWLHWISVIGF